MRGIRATSLRLRTVSFVVCPYISLGTIRSMLRIFSYLYNIHDTYDHSAAPCFVPALAH